MAVSFCPDGMRNAAWGRLKREDVLIVCLIGCRRQSVRPVYGKPQKGDVVSAVWKGKRDYAIKPLRRPTAGGRGMVVRLRCRVDKGIFYIAVASAFMFLKFLKPLIIF
ncbi:hypothetical protein HMPREF2638_09865 [Neisseria sp. HMSC055F11]|nr:hypothetical protein HMPREF2638_09865 [Neisseria sp. HMSC055F11]